MRRLVWLCLLGVGCDRAYTPSKADSGCLYGLFVDADGDGHGDPLVAACAPAEGVVDVGDDCNDGNSEVHPGAVEACDGVDNDCDGAVDEDAGGSIYLDEDGDGYGVDDSSGRACELPSGYSFSNGDCDDAAEAIHPGAVELCNGVDDDCNALIDDGVPEGVSPFWVDGDFDGFGAPGDPIYACEAPEGYADNDDDCDDTSAATYPGATDNCNGADDDCDGAVDEDAAPGWWLGTVDANTATMLRIDPTDATTTIESSIAGEFDINTTAVREDGLSIAQDRTLKEFWSLDACTGNLVPVGPTNSGPLCGIAFGPSGLLYGIDILTDSLIEFNLDTGTSRVIGALGVELDRCGMAYDCSNGRVLGANGSTGEVFDVDLKTGEARTLSVAGIVFDQMGLEFDPRNGLVYASTREELYSIEPDTGATTFIGDIGALSVDDLALQPSCD